MGGEMFHYIYNSASGEVYTQDFPGIRVHQVKLPCGTTINHDQLALIVKDKITYYDNLADSFSSLSEADGNIKGNYT